MDGVTTNTSDQYAVADAIRKVTTRLNEEWESGNRANSIDLYEFIDAMLSIAEELDPPLPARKDASDATP